MKVGAFTALLSQLPLDEVLKKLKAFQIDTAELGPGTTQAMLIANYRCLITAPHLRSSRAGWLTKVRASALSVVTAMRYTRRKTGAAGARDKPQDDSAG